MRHFVSCVTGPPTSMLCKKARGDSYSRWHTDKHRNPHKVIKDHVELYAPQDFRRSLPRAKITSKRVRTTYQIVAKSFHNMVLICDPLRTRI